MALKLNWRAGVAIAAISVLAGCTETAVLDAFDSGNRAEDNGALVSNQPLSVPPDLALRKPDAASAPVSTTSNGLQVQQGQRAPGTTYQTQQPTWQNTAPAQQQQQQAYQAPRPPADASAGISNSVVQSRNPADEPYLRHGINPYNPDGTRKKQSVLDKEARAKKIELERAKNPNYGTVFNAGELWTSD